MKQSHLATPDAGAVVNDLTHQVAEAVDVIGRHLPERPQVGIVLGTGLGALAEEVLDPVVLDFAEIPHFAVSTALGHAGRLVCGHWHGRQVMVMNGRLHAYEGYSRHQITLPVRVMATLGAQRLIASNASGGLNPRFRVGEMMVVDDHIDLMRGEQLLDPPEPSLPVGTGRGKLYDQPLAEQAQTIARREGFTLHRGVYAAVTGPNYETRAEYRMLRRLGADAVGMSTVPEALVAAKLGLQVLVVSAVTNVCRPDALDKTTGAEVVAAATSCERNMRRLMAGILEAE